jgi:pimeloyl-ACP methyl ester carboxylesterase
MFGLLLLIVVAVLFFRQHSMIYHPRPYDASYAHALPPTGVAIKYNLLGAGKETAYFIPARDAVPARIWLAFCGNGSLALDWTTILRGYPRNGDAFLLIDYPGYGRNAGYASVALTRAGAEEALRVTAERSGKPLDQIRLCVIGHSLGSAAAIDFAAHHRVEKLVVFSPFTSLRAEAARIVGRWLAHVLIDNYDNVANLRTALRVNPALRVAIIHGTEDDVVPFQMGRELAASVPSSEFLPVKGGDHGSILETERERVIHWMND